jgi:hypothetical protein
MAQVLRSLDSIATGRCVFEKDQVLTHAQLNGLADHLDDQGRLTRVTLVGVGIAGGLHVSLDDGRVVISRGVAVTTDGDLLQVDADATFDRWKPYDETAPVYPPFYDDTTMRRVFELVRSGAEDAAARPLSEFQQQSGAPLASMVGVLYVESYVKDDDLCSGTDCDNKGQDALNTVKLLIVDPQTAAALERNLPTPDAAAAALPVVAADRPLFPRGIQSVADLEAGYRAAGASIHGQLGPALKRFFPVCGPFLADLFGADPAPDWLSRLDKVQDALAAGGPGVQYGYDFLKDLVETYEAFRESLFGDTSVTCPDVAAFPKHVLLGVVSGRAGSRQHRTDWYPSPAIGTSADPREHARFLAWKLHTLIHTFTPLPANAPLRIVITPSPFEDRPVLPRRGPRRRTGIGRDGGHPAAD